LKKLILGIETSCDETAASVVEDGQKIRSNVVSTQIEIHREYGGIVPELASRHHLENIRPVIDLALKRAKVHLSDIDAIAVTVGPGLVGALLVGLTVAKSLCYALQKPLIPVNHLAGHIFSIFLERPPVFPLVALVVSGGHTDLYLVRGFAAMETLGRTRDDAAGECLDKAARVLNLSYPGGPIIERLATGGDPRKISFPRPMLADPSLDFSFSGLKTCLRQWVTKNAIREEGRAGPSLGDVAASFQEAVVDVLVAKTLRAAEERGTRTVVASGGVASNARLREKLRREGTKRGMDVHFPSIGLCTDNAAMIAATGYFQGSEVGIDGSNILALDASANLNL